MARPWNAAASHFALALGVIVTASSPAEACGGFFCSRTPVDQTAERIIFAVNDDATITAYVQIAYAGERDAFAWVVPVPAQPELDVGFPDLAMQGLDIATEPQYFKNSCFVGDGALNGGGPAATRSEADEGVTVLAREAVGPFDTVTLEGTSADVLVDWLQREGYRINDSMRPYIQVYVDARMKFVAMKLLPDADVTDIEPIILRYVSDQPMIPIRLTAVAAQPEMSIKTWILANERYAPQNFEDLRIDDSLIEFDQYGFRNNYLTVVSREADKVGGQAFVTEYAKPTSELIEQFEDAFLPPNNPDAVTANEAVLELLRGYRYVTRLYTRMSAEEMTRDPEFNVSMDQSEVDNVHDLTDPEFDYSQCQDEPEPGPCTFTYCGRYGVCVTTDAGLPACVCASEATARPTTTAGQVDLYCEPIALDLTGAGETTALPGEPGFSNPCEGFSCGEHGECVTMNGNPTCACEAGYGAVAESNTNGRIGSVSTALSCERVGDQVPPLPKLPAIPADGMIHPTNPDEPPSERSGGGCVVRGAGPLRTSGVGGFALVVGALAALGRRRPSTRSSD